MMNRQNMDVMKRNRIAKDTVELVLQNEPISQTAEPGQFLHIYLPHYTLRRPISIASVDRSNNTVTILFKVVGDGTALLADYQPGMSLDVIGPNGNGFPVTDIPTSSSILLIGGGIGVPPLYFLAEQLSAMGVNVKAILGFQKEEYVFYEEAFNKIAETIVVTDDGSYGQSGFVTDWIEAAGEFERYYSCGPLPMLKAVSHVISDKEGFLSFEERLGCGVGACLACVIPTNDEAGYKKICQDGPVFAAKEVKL